MGQIQGRRHCKECKKKTLHERRHFSLGMGCLLTVITGGLFIPIWLIVLVLEAFQPWICQSCGRSRMT